MIRQFFFVKPAGAGAVKKWIKFLCFFLAHYKDEHPGRSYSTLRGVCFYGKHFNEDIIFMLQGA